MRRLRVQLTVLLALLGLLDLAAVVERILSPFRAMAAKHTIRTKLPVSLPVVWGDPTRSSRY